MSIQCNPVDMPAVDADFCAPVLNFGQIRKIYVGHEGQPLADFADATEWASRLDNADVSAGHDKIRMFHVVGDKPTPERSTIDFSQGRKVYTAPSHTLNVTVDEVSENNYKFIQYLDANPGLTFRFWYESENYLYGGNEGVAGNFVLDDIIPQSKEELNTFVGTVTFEGGHPDRIANPL